MLSCLFILIASLLAGNCAGQSTTLFAGSTLVSISAPSSLSPASAIKSLPASTITIIHTPSTSSTSSPTQSHPLRSASKEPSHQTKIAIGVGLPVCFLMSFTLAFLVCPKRRKARLVSLEKSKAQREAELQEDVQAHIQQKAELEVEENKKVELEAQERWFEIGNEGQRYELSGSEEDMMSTRQELRGDEHPKELDVH